MFLVIFDTFSISLLPPIVLDNLFAIKDYKRSCPKNSKLFGDFLINLCRNFVLKFYSVLYKEVKL